MEIEGIDPIEHLRLILGRYRVTQEEIGAEIGVTGATISRALGGSSGLLPVVRKSIARWLSDHSADYPVEIPKEPQT